MTITVHDGQHGSPYDSYASLEAANEFHDLRATDEWMAASESKREAALCRATDYIDARYQGSFISDDGVSPLIVKATIILAVSALASDFAAPVKPGIIETEKELAGVGKTRIRYSESRISDPYPLITRLISPVTTSSGGAEIGRLIK